MSQLSDALDHLYTQFVLRDILAKFVPGLLTITLGFALISPKGLHIAHRLQVEDGLIPLLVLYGVSFMTGMFIQFIGMSLGLERIHVWDAPSSQERVRLSLLKGRDFLRDNGGEPTLLRVRERYAILKEMAGNYGVALLIIALFALVRALLWHGRLHIGLVMLSAALVAVAIVLLRQNRFHAREQLIWEGGSDEEPPSPSAGRPQPTARKSGPTRRSGR